MKWNLHAVTQPVEGALNTAMSMGEMSAWRAANPVQGYNDFYQETWDYNRRYTLYQELIKSEGLDTARLDYFEFGVAGGFSFKWWLEKNRNESSRFYGFDTFEGLPEKWGAFEKGSMAYSLESLNISDSRARFYKGLFQDTLIPFLESYDGAGRRLIHIDSDLFSSALFVMTQLYRFLKPGDILLFDEFAVPRHEFLAFKIFTESFYIKYDVIGAANNYLFVAIRIK